MTEQEIIKTYLEYNPGTGVFTWIKKSSDNVLPGRIAGTRHTGGYIIIYCLGKRYYAHRLAFLYMTGSIPTFVDHINRVRNDNRWANMRPATRSQNLSNKLSLREGFRGVCPLPNSKKNPFIAQIKKDGKKMHIGCFPTAEEAARAYDKKAIELFGEFACLNFPEEKRA